MRIAIFGLGYVGSVTGACLASWGHEVCGVDVAAEKVAMINRGLSPVSEKGMDRLVRQGVRAGRLRATADAREAVRQSDLSLVCVGTPSRRDGRANLDHVAHAMREIGRALRTARRYHTVALRSTVPPGTMERRVIPLLERVSGRRAERDFGACFHPEFLREGASVNDFFHPPKTVIGCAGPRSARRLAELWKRVKAPLYITSIRVAELVKYTDNAFHALKVAFANEIGSLSKRLEIDSRAVMKIFAEDTKLNISPLYLKPGFAFGGPCLPKDLRALCALGRAEGVEVPLLSTVLKSNSAHLHRAAELVLASGKKRIGMLGLVFKSDSDDLRESPACALAKRLMGAGCEVRIFDPRVRLERLMGANRTFIEKELPGLSAMLVSRSSELLSRSQVIVLTSSHRAFGPAIRCLKPGQLLVDCIGVKEMVSAQAGRTEGICW